MNPGADHGSSWRESAQRLRDECAGGREDDRGIQRLRLADVRAELARERLRGR